MTRNLVHRYYNNIMQINGGTNDGFAAWSDAGGLTMGYYDGSALAMWQVARRYTLADNFFMGAFGGSFLNHQYLVCACAPEYPDADRSPAKDLVSAVETDARGRVRLVAAPGAASSALAGAPRFVRDGDLTPKDERGMFHAVNTMQPAYQPSNEAAPAGGDPRYGNPAAAQTLPPQTRRDDRRSARRQGRLVGLVRRRVEGGERRHAGSARHHLQGRGPLPAAPSAVQLLRSVRPRDARCLPRRAPQGFRQRIPRRRRCRPTARGLVLQAARQPQPASRVEHGRPRRRPHRERRRGAREEPAVRRAC